jgi:hypothetical protein
VGRRRSFGRNDRRGALQRVPFLVTLAGRQRTRQAEKEKGEKCGRTLACQSEYHVLPFCQAQIALCTPANFIAPTSFANPALARNPFSDTFAPFVPADAPALILAPVLGALASAFLSADPSR